MRASGEVVARVTSGGIGYTVGASIAYAYLPTELAVTGTAVDVEVFGELDRGRGRGRAALRPEGRTRQGLIGGGMSLSTNTEPFQYASSR